MKYVCRQVSPEHQESPMMVWDDMEDNEIYAGLFLVPDRWCKGIREKELEDVRHNMEDIIDEYNDIQNYGKSSYYKNFSEVVNDILPRKDGKKYSTQQIHKWKEMCENFEEDSRDYAKIFSIMTGTFWDCRAIHGCSQGDYAEVIYNTEMWTDKAIECLETEYFNLGSEWMCDFTGIEDNTEIDENCIDEYISDGAGVYAYSWNNDDIKQELADNIGCDAKDVIMFEYAGSYSTSVYKRI